MSFVRRCSINKRLSSFFAPKKRHIRSGIGSGRSISLAPPLQKDCLALPNMQICLTLLPAKWARGSWRKQRHFQPFAEVFFEPTSRIIPLYIDYTGQVLRPSAACKIKAFKRGHTGSNPPSGQTKHNAVCQISCYKNKQVTEDMTFRAA